jgi:Ca2+-binding EF-hand superfamily protein
VLGGELPPIAAQPLAASDGLFGQLDRDGDGQLTLAEAGDEHAMLYRRLLGTSDDNGDGQLSADEFAGGLTPLRAERSIPEKQGSTIPGSTALLVIVHKMDVNGDLRIVRDEVPAQLQDVFARMLERGDQNKDGRLDGRDFGQQGPRLIPIALQAARRLGIDFEGEFASLPRERRLALERLGDPRSSPGRDVDPQQAAELFARLDANGDGRVTLEEVPEALLERFGRAIRFGDRNGDDQLTKEEFQTLLARRAAADRGDEDPQAVRRATRQMLARLDRDRDGVLQRRELPRRLAEAFHELDLDANGQLEPAELRPLAQRMLGRSRDPKSRDQRPASP